MIQSWLSAMTAPMLALQTSSIWMPQAGSLHAPAIDTLMRVSLLALTAAGILAQIILLAGLFLPREKRPRFSPTWRWIASAVFAACMVWMTVVAENLWSTIRLTHAAANAVQVEVTGVQFEWYFRYPGADGIYGAIKPNLVDAAGGNPLGLDPADPHSHDDIVSSVLELPVDQQAEIRLRAQDVIHGFLRSRHAGHAKCDARHAVADPHHANSHWRLRDCLFTALRDGALSNACCVARRFATGFRRVDGATPGWRARRTSA